MDFVTVALRLREACGLAACGERGFAILRRAPNLATVGRPNRCRIHWLHRRVVLEWITVNSFDLLSGSGDRRLCIAILIADGSFFGCETFFQKLCERGA